jgi:dTDP-4-dehydrorhamnose 3,5-epimerase
MEEGIIHDVIQTPLKIIQVSGGDVLHAMKCDDSGFSGFGESYFSSVDKDVVKAWKRHHSMVLNIVVPVGKIRFVLYDDRPSSPSCNKYQIFELSKENYFRLTVPPMIWMGFQGVNENINILLNIASIPHVPEEADRKMINEFDFDWGNT